MNLHPSPTVDEEKRRQIVRRKLGKAEREEKKFHEKGKMVVKKIYVYMKARKMEATVTLSRLCISF